MGMTTTYPDGARGTAVREADVELNAKVFDFTVSGVDRTRAEGTSRSVPLEAVLVHELGHVLGLGDVCIDAHALGPKVAQDCPPEQRERVMFAPALLGQPTARDIAELCSIHALQAEKSGREGETTASNGLPSYSASVVALLLVVAGAMVVLRRRTS